MSSFGVLIFYLLDFKLQREKKTPTMNDPLQWDINYINNKPGIYIPRWGCGLEEQFYCCRMIIHHCCWTWENIMRILWGRGKRYNFSADFLQSVLKGEVAQFHFSWVHRKWLLWFPDILMCVLVVTGKSHTLKASCSLLHTCVYCELAACSQDFSSARTKTARSLQMLGFISCSQPCQWSGIVGVAVWPYLEGHRFCTVL